MNQQEFERALQACASEPIHQIGHVQPHGALLAISCDKPHRVCQASQNIAEFVGRDLENVLNQPLANVLGLSALAHIDELILAINEQPTASGKIVVQLDAAPVELMLHVYASDNLIVLEMERDEGRHQEALLADLLLQTQQSMLRTDSYFETGRYFDLIVQLVRSLTGYDSVMVYRFDPHWNGEIIAQSRIEKAPSYLGMHFPASDIPAQARRLYTTNLVRTVANVDACPVPIVPELNPTKGQPLDLTYSALRSLSPIHIEYLRNIGVHSSMVISLIQNGRLWGLIACHHLAPKPVSMGLREAAIFLSRLVSSRLSTIEAMEQTQLTDSANLIVGDLLRALPMSPVREILLRLMPELQELLSASGMIVVVEGEIHLSGDVPDQEQITQLRHWLSSTPKSEVAFSDFLGRDCPELAGAAESMAGILTTPPSPDMHNCIIWLRKEKPRTINWAGKYEEGFVQNAAGNYRLTPRKSFELWTESWRGRCSPWTPVEIGVATMLALAIPESLSQKKLLEEAQELQLGAEAELRMHRDHLEQLVQHRTLELSIAKEAAESANRAKTAFLSSVSHELRTPMNAIMGITTLAQRRTEDPKLLDYFEKMKEASARLLAVINDMIAISEIESERLTLNLKEFQLTEITDHVKKLMMPKAVEKNLALEFENLADMGSLSLYGDRDRVGQILLSLIDNALKFTSVGSISVRVNVSSKDTSHVLIRFEVQDTGIGVSDEARSKLFRVFEQADGAENRRYGGTGLGLAICLRLVKLMGGDIGVKGNEGPGSTFWFSVLLPVISSHPLQQG
ncbi:MAG: bacteriophytochrome [Proteobacteria bacterium]|nr:bacteriophytochrome [Pseudomonadota bacterium]